VLVLADIRRHVKESNFGSATGQITTFDVTLDAVLPGID